MRKLLLAGAAALATATPALAQTNAAFVGPRAQATVGVADVRDGVDNVSYGISAGVDDAVSDRATIGFDLDATDFADNDRRVLGAGVRAGYAVHPSTLLFARAGVATTEAPGEDAVGYSLGGGAEFALSRRVYATTEYRFSDYNRGVGSTHGVRVGLGIRF